MPFAVVGSDKLHELDGREILGRLTNWGLIEGKQSLSIFQNGSSLDFQGFDIVIENRSNTNL